MFQKVNFCFFCSFYIVFLIYILEFLFKTHPYEEVAYDIHPLQNNNQEVGAGIIGELEQEMDSIEFLKLVKTKMKTNCVRHTDICKTTIKKVAICGGSGSFLLQNSIQQNADIFITGDFKYHEFFDAENHLIIADIGHYESEQFTIELFREILETKFETIKFMETKINTNPINSLEKISYYVFNKKNRILVQFMF